MADHGADKLEPGAEQLDPGAELSEVTMETVTLTGEDGATHIQIYAMGNDGVATGQAEQVMEETTLIENDGNVYYFVQPEGETMQGGVNYVMIDEDGNQSSMVDIEQTDLQAQSHISNMEIQTLAAEPPSISLLPQTQTILQPSTRTQPKLAIFTENNKKLNDMTQNDKENPVKVHLKSNVAYIEAKDETSEEHYQNEKNVDDQIVKVDVGRRVISGTEVGKEVEEDQKEQEDDSVKFSVFCQYCGETLDTLQELKEHLLEVHDMIDEDVDDAVGEALEDGIDVQGIAALEASTSNGDLENDSPIDKHAGGLGRHKCQFCNEIFDVRSDLDVHIEQSHDAFAEFMQQSDGLYHKCPYCPRLYLSKWSSKSLRRHIRVDHPGERADVDFAMVEVKDKSNLRKRTKKFIGITDDKEGVDTHTCRLCSRTFHWYKSLVRHMRIDHVQQLGHMTREELAQVMARRQRRSLEEAGEDVTYQCPHCSRDFMWRKSLKRHCIDVHNDTSINFERKVTKKYHHVGKKSQSMAARDYFKCVHCSLVSKYASSIRSHMLRKHEVEDAATVELPRVEASVGKLKAKANDPRPRQERLLKFPVVYKCPKCPYASPNPANLYRHLTSKVHNETINKDELSMAKYKVKQKPPRDTDSEVEDDNESMDAIDDLDKENGDNEGMDEETFIERDEVEDILQAEDEVTEVTDTPDTDIPDKHTPGTDTAITETSGTTKPAYKISDVLQMCKTSTNLKVTFKCLDCSEHFGNFEKLQEHHTSSHPAVAFSVLPNDVLEVEHVKGSVKALKALECPYCDIIFSQAVVLQQHIVLNHKASIEGVVIKAEPVDVDAEIYKEDGTIGEATHTRTAVTAYRCQACICVFQEVLDLVRHMRIIHPDTDKSVPKTPKKRGRKRKVQASDNTGCDAVSTDSPVAAASGLSVKAAFKSPTSSRSATEGSGVQFDNKCPHCPFSCKRASALTFHINFNHAKIKSEPETEEPTRKKPRRDGGYFFDKETPSKKNKETPNKKSQWDFEQVTDGMPGKESQNELDEHVGKESVTPKKKSQNKSNKDITITDGTPGKEVQNDLDGAMLNDIDATLGKDLQNDADYHVKKETDVTPEKLSQKKSWTARKGKRKITQQRHSTEMSRKKSDNINAAAKEEPQGHDGDAEDEYVDACLDLGDDDDLDYHPDQDSKTNLSLTLNDSDDDNVTKPSLSFFTRYKCPYCNEGAFISARILEKHVKKVHNDKSFSVSDIKSEEPDFSTSTDPSKDTATHKCTYCKRVYSSQEQVHQHMNKIHRFGKKRVSTKAKHSTKKAAGVVKCEAGSVGYRCKFCSMMFQTEAAVIRHAGQLHPKETLGEDVIETVINETKHSLANHYQCPYCTRTSIWKKCIVRHVRDCHPGMSDFNTDHIQITLAAAKDEDKKLPEVGRFQCPVCQSIHKWKKSFIRHIRSMHPEEINNIDLTTCILEQDPNTITITEKRNRKVYCPLCNFTCRVIKKMQKHFSEKHPEECTTVMGSMFQYSYVTTEQPQVESSMPGAGGIYSCHLCGTNYSWRKSLVLHMKRHHPLEADVFNTVSSMVHVISKALDKGPPVSSKVWACPLCDAVFRTSCAKQGHMRLKHGQAATNRLKSSYVKRGAFSCGACKRRFPTRRLLAIHRATGHFRTKALKCRHCPQSCSNLQSLTFHQHNCGTTKYWTCKEAGCSFKCVLKSSLKLHTRKQHPPQTVTHIKSDSSPYSCELCSFPMFSMDELKTHLMSEHHNKNWHLVGLERRKRRFACYKCPETFSLPSLRDEHISEHHRELSEMCELCGDIFPTLVALRKHTHKHKDDVRVMMGPKTTCEICNKEMLARNLHKHYLYRHLDSCVCDCKICTNPTLAWPSGKPCKLCNLMFCRKLQLDAHMRLVHNVGRNHKNSYRCKFCNQLFTTNKQRFQHMHRQHANEVGRSRVGGAQNAPPTQVQSTSQLEAECVKESVGVEDKENPSTHVIHIGEGQGSQYLPKLSEASLSAVIKELMIVNSDKMCKLPYKCLLCGKCFARTKYIRIHIRRSHVKDEDQPYRCKICGSGFVRITEFRKHSRSHSGFRPYKCKTCGKAFKQQANLTDHQNIHNRTKRYQCFICKRYFRQKGALNSHCVTHDKLKPFKCVFCEKAFTCRGELSRHMQHYNLGEGKQVAGGGVAGGRSFMCHICLDSFSHFPLLLKHIEENHPERPFQCQVCKVRFAAYNSLYTHKVKTEHFLPEEIEPATEETMKKRASRKPRSSKDVQEAVYTIEQGAETSIVQSDLQDASVQESMMMIQSGELYEVQAPGSTLRTDSSPLEVVIEQFQPEEVVSGSHVPSENEELLSIAKQLTQLSTYTTEAVETDSADALEEEDEIMKRMLDADSDLLANLGKQLVSTKKSTMEPVWQRQQQHGNAVTEEEFETENDQFANSSTVEISQGVDLTLSLAGDSHASNVVSTTLEGRVVTEGQSVNAVPSSMEELATLIAQNSQIPDDGVTAYQTEDGSIIYVCMDQANQEKEASLDVVETSNEFIEAGAVQNSFEGNDRDSEEIVQEEQVVGIDEEIAVSSSAVVTVVPTVTTANELTTTSSDGVMENEGGSYIVEGHGEVTEAELQMIVAQNQGSKEENDVVEDENQTVEYVNHIVDDGNHIIEDGSHIAEEGNHLTEDGRTYIIEDGNQLIEADDQTMEVIAEGETGQPVISVASQMIELTDGTQVGTGEAKEVVEYIQDERTFIKEELMDEDFSDIGTGIASIDANLHVIYEDNVFKCLKCVKCGYTSISKKNMNKHLRRHIPMASRQCICQVCDKRFVTNSEVSRHMAVHTNERKHKCVHCGKSFRQPGHLQSHVKSHLGQKDYACSDCPRRFITSTQCKAHWQRVHSNTRYQCDECDKLFSDKVGLMSHKGAVHSESFKSKKESESGPHQCHICGASFVKKVYLSQHLQKHNPKEVVNRYMCEVCGEGFRFKSALHDHVSLQHSDKSPEICEYCGDSFKVKRHLNAHIKSKHQPKVKPVGRMYTCVCKKTFTSRNSMAYHVGTNPACQKGKVTCVKSE